MSERSDTRFRQANAASFLKAASFLEVLEDFLLPELSTVLVSLGLDSYHFDYLIGFIGL